MSCAIDLKAKIRNIANQKSIPIQVVLQNYMFERLLVRLSKSEYKEKFILKGDYIVAAIVGLDNCETMVLDTVSKMLPLTTEAITEVFQKICVIDSDDEITFDISNVTPILDDDIYKGHRVVLNAKSDTMVTSLFVDVFAVDSITSNHIEYTVSEIFDNKKSYRLWSYNIETIIAEKVEKILRRGELNACPRDFYDTYILATTQRFDKLLFTEALKVTFSHRGTAEQILDIPGIMKDIKESVDLQAMWEKYREQFVHAERIKYTDIMKVLNNLLTWF